MNTVGELHLLPVWVNPQHLTLTAVHIMLGHKIKALAVLDRNNLSGIVTLEDVLSSPNAKTVADVMKPVANLVQSDRDVRDVADEFVRNEWDFAPVVTGDRFVGILTPNTLLRELGRSYDPLTKLSWSDLLREWGVSHLKDGEEITIIFIDLNQFGRYNKKYGHIVGDRVIRTVAEFLRENTNPELDVLVRYGGDEFCIGTLRDRDESEALAKVLQSRFADRPVEGADEPVSFSVGLFGGRRHKERENVHYAATIDNLINIASRNCQANKQALKAISHEESAPPPKVQEPAPLKYQVLNIFAPEQDSPEGVVTVVLGKDGQVFSGADMRESKPLADSVAEATARAIERAAGVQISVRSVAVTGGAKNATATVSGQIDGKAASGTRAVGPAGVHEAVAEAAIEAFGR